MPTDPIASFLRELSDMLSRVHRWTHMPSLPAGERETVLAHSYVSVLLAAAMLADEERHGRHRGQLDHARILLAAALHDAGEGRVGDVHYVVKNDPRVRDHLGAIEREFADRMFADLPAAARDRFREAYAVVDSDSLEGRFFNAVERVGYVHFAVPQFRAGRKDFLIVFQNQHEKILALEEEFVSVRMAYEPYRVYVGEVLRKEAEGA